MHIPDDAELRQRPVPDRLIQAVYGAPAGRWRDTPTRAELDVLRCLSHGMTLVGAADELGRSYQTVLSQVRSARRRLRAKSNPQAVAIVIRRRLID